MAKNAAIIMAAGLGTRMKSRIPKILHEVCGKPMLQWVIDALQPLNLDRIIVVLGNKNGEEFDLIKGKIDYVIQKEKKGTGHAIMQAEKALEGFNGNVLILSGDVPLITTATLKDLLGIHQDQFASATILTALVDNPTGYGRILRNREQVVRIVEELDADDYTRIIKEVNTGTYCFRNDFLRSALKQIRLNPIKKEYYLTDVFEILNRQSQKILPFKITDASETMGVNKRYELQIANKIMQQRIQKKLMDEGITILDASNTYIDGTVKIGQDSVVYPFSSLYGNITIGENCEIGPFAHIIDSKIGHSVKVFNSYITNSVLEDNVHVGPFSHIRNNTLIQNGAHIGNFVEIARSKIGPKSRAYHLSYLGDTDMGADVNLGAGIITANWDMKKKKKNRTVIEDGASIGSNTVLVAPARVKQGSVIPAQSTIKK